MLPEENQTVAKTRRGRRRVNHTQGIGKGAAVTVSGAATTTDVTVAQAAPVTAAAALPADHRPPGGLARAGQPQLYYGV